MSIEENYTPTYITDLDDLPIAGPDDYTAEEKRKALFHAESEFEWDVNEGAEVTTVENIHKVAILNLATHILTHAAEDPSSVTLGDMASGGGTITQYSSRYLDAYNILIEKILSSEGTRSDNFAVFVNTANVGDDSTTHTVS